MVSRRKILSRSRDDLNLDQTFNPQEEEEDVWYQKEKLYKVSVIDWELKFTSFIKKKKKRAQFDLLSSKKLKKKIFILYFEWTCQ